MNGCEPAYEIERILEKTFDSINEFGGYRFETVKYDPSLIQNMIDATEFSDIEKSLGLDKFNEVYILFDQCSARERIVVDLQMRHARFDKNIRLRNGPQAHLHFEEVADKRFAPRYPFDLPSFYYHFCRPEMSITTVTHNRDQEFTFKINCMYNTNPTFRLFNGHVEMYDHAQEYVKLPGNFGQNIFYRADPLRADVYSKPGQHSEVTVNGIRLYFEDGLIKNDKGYLIEVYLNNRRIWKKEKIQKVEFFSASANSIEVMILFAKSQMAGGSIWKKKKVFSSEPTTLIVSVEEIPGTYGTSDFQCSPNFKSMMRTSRMGPKRRPIPPKHEVKKKIDENRMFMMPKLDEVLLAVFFDEDKSNLKLKHTDKGMGHQLCTSFCKLERALYLLQIESIIYPPGSENWTSREKVASALFLAEIAENACPYKDRCVPFLDALQMCAVFVDDVETFPIQGELLLEFSYQLMSNLFAIDQYINNDKLNGPSQKYMHIATWLPFYYLADFQTLRKAFTICQQPLKEVVLDIICRRATPSQYSDVMDLYHYEREIVVKAFQTYPHIMLFGHFPANPCLELVDSLGVYMDEVLLQESKEWDLDVPQRVLFSVKPEPQEENFNESEPQTYAQFHDYEGCVNSPVVPTPGYSNPANGYIVNYESNEYDNDDPEEEDEHEFLAPMLKTVKTEPVEEEPTSSLPPATSSPFSTTSTPDYGYYQNSQGFERKRKAPFDLLAKLELDSRESTPLKTPRLHSKANGETTFTPNRSIITPTGHKYRKPIPAEPTVATTLILDPSKKNLLDKIFDPARTPGSSPSGAIRRSLSGT